MRGFSNTSARPLVEVGLVVRNGATLLGGAIESILNQTHRHLSLVIYDNASTDDTLAVCGAYAAADARVRIRRHPRNIGPVANFVFAARHATAPYFCWATHDDLRDHTCIERLLNLLHAVPSAGLAASAVRDLQPDGTPLGIRAETSRWPELWPDESAARLCAFLRSPAATPFYGLYRTVALQSKLDVLESLATPADPPPFGLDVVFLLSFLRDHNVVYDHAALLAFRRGGYSHRYDMYGSLTALRAQLRDFTRRLREVAIASGTQRVARIKLAWSIRLYMARLLASASMRRMLVHYVLTSSPMMARLSGWWTTRTSSSFAVLRERCRALPRGSRIVVFGAGKHTRRAWAALQHAVGGKHAIVAVADDAAASKAAGPCPIVSPTELGSINPTVVLVSSDTYERELYRRARETAAPSTPVWCIYDRELENAA